MTIRLSDAMKLPDVRAAHREIATDFVEEMMKEFDKLFPGESISDHPEFLKDCLGVLAVGVTASVNPWAAGEVAKTLGKMD